MEKEYKLELSHTFHKMSTIYFTVGLWTTKDRRIFSWQIFLLLLISSCILSTTIKACTTDNNDESVFLAMVSLIGIVQIYRLYHIVWKQHKIIELMYASSASSTDDYETFCNANKKLTNFTMFVKYFLVITFSAFMCATFAPAVKKQLIINIAFPLDYESNESAFWIVHAYVSASFLVSIISCLVATMIWYIMLNIVVKFELLGNGFKRLGTTDEQGATSSKKLQPKQTLFVLHLIEAIKSLGNINECVARVSRRRKNQLKLKTFISFVPEPNIRSGT